MTNPNPSAGLNFRKEGDAEVADMGNIGILHVDLEFSQDNSGASGVFGRFRKVDPDLTVIGYVGSMPVDAADPKHRKTIFDGAVQHHGDAKGNGIESVTLRFADIAHINRDVSGFAFVMACTAGFTRLGTAVARFYDATTGEREHIDNVWFDITGTHTSALLGVIRKTPVGWQFRKAPAYGQAGNWREMASLATAQMR